MTDRNDRFRTRMKTLFASMMLSSAAIVTSPASAAITIASDPILYWNDIAVRNVATNAAAQTRIFAMLNIAMHDAVNATLGGPNSSYLGGVTSFGGDSGVAAAQAAHDVLVSVNNANAQLYHDTLNAYLATIADGAAKTNGIATGSAYAAAMITNRTGDGSSAVVTYTSTLQPGDWRPTTPGAQPAVPQWGGVRTFALSSVNAVTVAPPPALDSVEYAAAYNEVKQIGALNSLTRTLDQTNSALFWDAANGSTWVRAGLTIAEDEGLDTIGYARVFALLSSALADAAITGFDAKYDYRLWRPITAIQLGDTDGNAATDADPNWTSLFAAPSHPSYISTHSDLSAAAATILKEFFGDDEAFTFTIAGDTRSFTSLSQAELDAANSRLWGGIHFRFDNEAGLRLGRDVGALTLRSGLFAPVPESSTWMMLIVGFGIIGTSLRARAFKSPVTRSSVRTAACSC